MPHKMAIIIRDVFSKSLDNHLAEMSILSYLFDKYLLYTHYIPGIVLSTAETKTNTTHGSKCLAGILDGLQLTATHSSILAWRIPTDSGAWRATVHGVTKSRTRLSTYNT